MDAKQVFLKYKPERDVVFFFGAGASYADGAPLQQDILPYILSGQDETIAESGLGVEVVEFVKEYFGVDESHYPSLESVFGFIDYLISHRESLGQDFSVTTIQGVRESLVKLIHYTIARRCKAGSGIYGKFWNKVHLSNRNVGVVTTNYDSLLDDAFSLYPDSGYIDYCLHLMNYDHYETHHREIDPFNWWVNPREPVTEWGGSVASPIKIIKLHGSLDWKYCGCCAQVLLTPWSSEIDLDRSGFIRYEYYEGSDPHSPDIQPVEFTCPIDGARFDTLIVPPSHVKELTNPVISSLRIEAARELRCAKTVVFVGYSFPDADVHIRVLLKKNIKSATKVIVIDPMIDDRKRQGYSTLSDKVEFYEMPFSDALENEALLAKMFPC